MSTEQERTKAAEAQAKQAEMQALAAQHATNTERVRWEEQRKTKQFWISRLDTMVQWWHDFR